MSDLTAGEQLFAVYLETQHMQAVREYQWSHTTKRPDYRYDHPVAGTIIIEQKDICIPPPRTSGAFDSYAAIRSHIHAARVQFKPFKEYPCVLVLFTDTHSPLVDLSNARVMLGAMYGDLGFKIPYSPTLGHFDRSQMTQEFLVKRGKMLQPSGGEEPRKQNTRIAALVTLHRYDVQHLRRLKHARKPGGYAEIMNGEIDFPVESRPGVTVWENAYADRRLPQDIFRGPLDQWWTLESDGQQRSYIGLELQQLLEK